MHPSAQVADGRRITRWSRDSIIEKIQEWHARHGEAPCSADWNPSLARWRAQEWRVERYREGRWPSTNAVKRLFGGSFDEALLAAGLEPHRPGPRRVAGAARPDVAPRAPLPPRHVQDELAAALERAVRAEARAEAAERRLAHVHAHGRSAAEPGEARARRPVHVGGRVAHEPAARAHAAGGREAPAHASRQGAAPATAGREAPAHASRQGAPSATAAVEHLAPLARHEVEALRAGGPAGPAVLARALKGLAAARATGNRAALAAALGEVAAAAVRWRDRL
jgi:hypothetical protein